MVDRQMIALVGCPEKDVPAVEAVCADADVRVRAGGAVEDGDCTLFCVSSCYGPTEGTRRSVAALRGRRLVPLAIVLTDAELVEDDSLRSLVAVESRDLLATVLPESTVDDLPVLYDFAPNLAARVAALIRQGPAAITCRA